MPVISIARVSDIEQEDNFSIPAQKNRTEDYIEWKGLGKIDRVFEIVESASKKIRKRFDEVIDYIINSDELVILVVDTIDRIVRNFKDMIILDELRLQGKLEIHFVRENLIINKKSSSTDILRWDYGVLTAKSYVLNLSDNVKRSIQEKLRAKEWPGKAPIGYLNITIDKDTKDIIHDPNRAHLIRECFKLYSTGGYSIKTLRKEMKEQGLTNNNKTNSPISQGQMENILKNPFYWGEMLYDGALYPHRYEPIVSKELYDKVQAQLASWGKKPFKRDAKNFAYRGLFTCKVCGCMITPEDKRSGKHVYYHCTQYHFHHDARWYREDEVTEGLMDTLGELNIPDEAFVLLVDTLRQERESKNKFYADALSSLDREITKYTNRLDVLYEDRLDGRIDLKTYEFRSSKFQKDITCLKNRRSKLLSTKQDIFVTAEKVLELANNAKDIFRSSGASDKRALLNFLLQNALVDDENIEVTLKKPFDLILKANKNANWLPTVLEVRKCFIQN